VRLVFNGAEGPALNASLIDLGNRFRLLVNRVESVTPEAELGRLPVARVVWRPEPDWRTAATAWILGGGAHHTGYSQALTVEHLEDLAAMARIECLVIDQGTSLRDFQNQARYNDLYYSFARGLDHA
jgi:L-arabinose isomerase